MNKYSVLTFFCVVQVTEIFKWNQTKHCLLSFKPNKVLLAKKFGIERKSVVKDTIFDIKGVKEYATIDHLLVMNSGTRLALVAGKNISIYDLNKKDANLYARICFEIKLTHRIGLIVSLPKNRLLFTQISRNYSELCIWNYGVCKQHHCINSTEGEIASLVTNENEIILLVRSYKRSEPKLIGIDLLTGNKLWSRSIESGNVKLGFDKLHKSLIIVNERLSYIKIDPRKQVCDKMHDHDRNKRENIKGCCSDDLFNQYISLIRNNHIESDRNKFLLLKCFLTLCCAQTNKPQEPSKEDNVEMCIPGTSHIPVDCNDFILQNDTIRKIPRCNKDALPCELNLGWNASHIKQARKYVIVSNRQNNRIAVIDIEYLRKIKEYSFVDDLIIESDSDSPLVIFFDLKKKTWKYLDLDRVAENTMPLDRIQKTRTIEQENNLVNITHKISTGARGW